MPPGQRILDPIESSPISITINSIINQKRERKKRKEEIEREFQGNIVCIDNNFKSQQRKKKKEHKI